jgi:hypothetical protein
VTDTRDAARGWAATWQRCWETGEADPIVGLYSADITFSSEPFREPDRGLAGVRRYIEEAFGSESAVRAHFAEPIVDGRRAAVSWWADLVEDGKETTLAGTSILTFDEEGLVVDQWDAWNQAPARLAPRDETRFALRDT